MYKLLITFVVLNLIINVISLPHTSSSKRTSLERSKRSRGVLNNCIKWVKHSGGCVEEKPKFVDVNSIKQRGFKNIRPYRVSGMLFFIL